MVGTRRQGCWLAALAGLVTALALPASAPAAVGDLTYRGCLSSELASAACTPTPDVSVDGAGTGMSGFNNATTSPDGRFVYGAAGSTVAQLSRDPATGALAYVGCITGDSGITSCDAAPGASATGNNGLTGIVSLAISPDGRSLYAAAAGDDAIAHFSRDPQTGALTFQSCLSGEGESAPRCAQLASATPTGADSGLHDPEEIAISPDGRSLYAVIQGDNGLASFALDATGSPSFTGCLSGESMLAPCTPLPGATPTASQSGFASQQGVAVTRDGRSVYTVDDSDEAIAHFSREPATGAVSFVSCLSADTEITSCTPIPGATPGGIGTGLRSLVDVFTSPDLTSVYAVGDSENSLLNYRRDAASGALSFVGCISGSNTGADLCTPIPTATSNGLDSGLDFAAAGASAPDARSVYVAAASDDAVATFSRDPLTGAVQYVGCLGAETQSAGACAQIPGAVMDGENTGLNQLRELAPSPDGRSLYAAAPPDDSAARFDREADATGPQIQLEGKKKQRPLPGAARRAKRGNVRLAATCADELCTEVVAEAKLKVKLRGKRKGKRARYQGVSTGEVLAGQTAALKLKPKKKAKRLLKKARRRGTKGKPKVKVVATGADLLGNASTAKQKVKLKLKRKRR